MIGTSYFLISIINFFDGNVDDGNDDEMLKCSADYDQLTCSTNYVMVSIRIWFLTCLYSHILFNLASIYLSHHIFYCIFDKYYLYDFPNSCSTERICLSLFRVSTKIHLIPFIKGIRVWRWGMSLGMYLYQNASCAYTGCHERLSFQCRY